MPELVIRGLNLEQYAQYSAEASLVRQEWEKSEGKADIRDKMLAILAKYGQDPASCITERVDGSPDYSSCGLIAEWHDMLNNNPEMLVRYSQISGEFISKAMFGGADTSAGMTIEGCTLEKYAEVCAALQGKSEAECPGVLAAYGLGDMDKWKRISAGFSSAMGADTSLKLATHFGQLFAKYGQAHMQAGTQFSVDVVAEANEAQEARDVLQQKAVRELASMAAAGNGAGVIPYLKKTFPDDAEDTDVLDWHVDKALNMLAEAGNKDAARVLLGVRFDLRGEEGDKKEWIENELESLFL
jgi:hypothetical protein